MYTNRVSISAFLICVIFVTISCGNSGKKETNTSHQKDTLSSKEQVPVKKKPVIKAEPEKEQNTTEGIQNEGSKIIDDILENNKEAASDYYGFELMKKDCLGDFHLGMKVNEIFHLLGEPEEKTELEIWGADGEHHHSLIYTKKGIEFDIIGEKSADQEINMITITEPNALKTRKGIGIGSSLNEVKSAYALFIDPDFSNTESIVAGSIYGGIIFNFKDNKVISIFIGAAAE